MKEEKNCIRCWCIEKEIRKMWWKCLPGWWSFYERHDYSKEITTSEDWTITLPTKSE